MAYKLLATLLLLSGAAFAVCDGVSNCYIRAGATGSATGADWTNAVTTFPSSFVRGYTYWFAAGTYNAGSPKSLTTADSGSTYITLQAATVASHGTATGWSNSYVGQAVLPSIYLESDYWVINGAYRGSATGVPATDWRTGYGFKINNSSAVGANCVWMGPNSFPSANFSTVEFLECQGSGNTDGTIQDSGIEAFQSTNVVIQNNYIHDVGDVGILLAIPNVSTATVQYNWVMNNQSTPAQHGEGLDIKGGGGALTLTLAYNYLENIEGTGYIGTPNCGGCTGNWYIYGNVFFANPSEWHGNISPQSGLSYAYIQYFGASGNPLNLTTMAWYNNTFYQIATGMSITDCDALQTGFGDVANFIVENNLFVNCAASVVNNPAVGAVTRDHNSYATVTTISDTGTGVQNMGAVIPFTNTSTNDLTLSQDTAAWTALGAPYNVDLLGNTRTSSRGAFQFNGAPGAAFGTNIGIGKNIGIH